MSAPARTARPTPAPPRPGTQVASRQQAGSVASVPPAAPRPSTTPRLFSLLRTVTVILTLLFAALTAGAGYYAQAQSAAAGRDAQQFVRVAQIRGHLMRAHARAYDNFTAANPSSADQKAYTDELGSASALLVEAGAASSTDLLTLTQVTQHLVTYATDVQAAMTAKQMAEPGTIASTTTPGQASLQDAGTVLLTQVDPQLQELADHIDTRLRDHARGVTVGLIVLPGVVALGALVATGVLMALRTHRILNVGVVVATVLVLIAVVVAVSTLTGAESRARTSLDSSHASTQAAAQAQTAGATARFAEARRLLGDTSAATQSQFDTAATATTNAIAGIDPGHRKAVLDAWNTYADAARANAALQQAPGGREKAVAAALGTGPVASGSLFQTFESQAADAVDSGGQQSASAFSGMTTGLQIACVAVGLLAIGAACASSIGISRRLAEYR